MPHARLTDGKLAAKGKDGGLLAQAHDPRSGQDVDVSGAKGDRGIALVDGQVDLRGESGLDGHGG
jgi:hypothetical protein